MFGIRKHHRKPGIAFDDEGVTRQLGNGDTEHVAWDELSRVDVVTTDDGPFAEDVFIVLHAGDHGCVVPQHAADEALVNRLLALPGFDHDAFIRAMSSAEIATFVCWRAAP